VKHHDITDLCKFLKIQFSYQCKLFTLKTCVKFCKKYLRENLNSFNTCANKIFISLDLCNNSVFIHNICHRLHLLILPQVRKLLLNEHCFRFNLLFAMTDHKSQGRTLQCVIFDLSCCKALQSPNAMLSRATSLDGIQILQEFPKGKDSGQAV
jgi:hypothetical protein